MTNKTKTETKHKVTIKVTCSCCGGENIIDADQAFVLFSKNGVLEKTAHELSREEEMDWLLQAIQALFYDVVSDEEDDEEVE